MRTADRLALLLASCLLVAAPAAAGIRCFELPLDEQRPCLRKLAPAALAGFLAGSDGATDDVQAAAVLDALRSRGRDAAPAAEALSALLPHQHPLYRERDKLLVLRLRAYIVATLADVGVPASALPPILDMLAHPDDRVAPLEIGAAARAVRTLGTRGRAFAPYLLEALRSRVSIEEFSLERYTTDFPPSEATTVQLEAIRALSAIGALDEAAVLAEMRRLAADRAREDPRAVIAARRALEQVK